MASEGHQIADPFWSKFTSSYPTPPSKEQLVCLIIEDNYPEGILTGDHSDRSQFTRHFYDVNDELFETFEGASHSLSGFITTQAKARGTNRGDKYDVYTDYYIAWIEAGLMIYEALKDEDLILLDDMYWDCHRANKLESSSRG